MCNHASADTSDRAEQSEILLVMLPLAVEIMKNNITS